MQSRITFTHLLLFWFMIHGITATRPAPNKTSVCVRESVVWFAHHGRGGCGLVHLVLCSLNFGLQVRWRVKVLALFPGAPPLDVVHAHRDGVVVGVDHGTVSRVSEAAIVLPPGAVPPLVLSAHLQPERGST